MKTEFHQLFSWLGINATIATNDAPSTLHPYFQLTQAVTTNDSSAASHCYTTRKLTMAELESLAEQFNLASIQIRQYIQSRDDGRSFELAQAIAFGADRLEGDLPNGPENTD